MYIAAKEFINPVHGRIKKGANVSDLWPVKTLESMAQAGIVEKAIEVKPAPAAKKETKPLKRNSKKG